MRGWPGVADTFLRQPASATRREGIGWPRYHSPRRRTALHKADAPEVLVLADEQDDAKIRPPV